MNYLSKGVSINTIAKLDKSKFLSKGVTLLEPIEEEKKEKKLIEKSVNVKKVLHFINCKEESKLLITVLKKGSLNMLKIKGGQRSNKVLNNSILYTVGISHTKNGEIVEVLCSSVPLKDVNINFNKRIILKSDKYLVCEITPDNNGSIKNDGTIKIEYMHTYQTFV